MIAAGAKPRDNSLIIVGYLHLVYCLFACRKSTMYFPLSFFYLKNDRRSVEDPLSQQVILPAASATAAPIMAPMALSARSDAIWRSVVKECYRMLSNVTSYPFTIIYSLKLWSLKKTMFSLNTFPLFLLCVCAWHSHSLSQFDIILLVKLAYLARA